MNATENNTSQEPTLKGEDLQAQSALLFSKLTPDQAAAFWDYSESTDPVGSSSTRRRLNFREFDSAYMRLILDELAALGLFHLADLPRTTPAIYAGTLTRKGERLFKYMAGAEVLVPVMAGEGLHGCMEDGS